MNDSPIVRIDEYRRRRDMRERFLGPQDEIAEKPGRREPWLRAPSPQALVALALWYGALAFCLGAFLYRQFGGGP